MRREAEAANKEAREKTQEAERRLAEIRAGGGDAESVTTQQLRLLVGLAFGPALLGQSVRPATLVRAAAAQPRLARERRAAAAALAARVRRRRRERPLGII